LNQGRVAAARRGRRSVRRPAHLGPDFAHGTRRFIIVLLFPDGSSRQLEDGDAREFADRLWKMAHGASTAVIAAAVRYELNRDVPVRRPVKVPEASADRVREALTWE
jgi:hypothetical protein